MPKQQRIGLTRLAAYLPGQRLRVAALGVVGLGMAVTQVGPLLIVRDAIDNGMTKRNDTRLWEDVVLFLGRQLGPFALEADFAGDRLHALGRGIGFDRPIRPDHVSADRQILYQPGDRQRLFLNRIEVAVE